MTAVRHTTGQEDWENFTNTTCNFCYPMNGNAIVSEKQTITLSSGLEPVSDQPWAGPLINGRGRAIPMNYSSSEGSSTSESWGPPAGSYFSVNVKKGTCSAGGARRMVWRRSHSHTTHNESTPPERQAAPTACAS